ncbi:TPA: MFS transporter, partial [Candidatus Poribacteria bacterium]|nr:MFS transporter [Candidatus Poribacteria bacterium]
MWNPKFVSLCLLLFLTGVTVAPIQFFFPIYVEEGLGKMVWHAAILRAIPIAIGGFFALIGGGLCDRFGKKMTFLIGMTGSIVVGGVFVVKLDIIILCILCYQGIAVGLRTAGGQSYLIQSVDPKALGLATAIYFQSRNIGEAIGNAIGGELITRFDYGFVGYTTIITMSILMFMAIWMLPTDTQNKESSDIKSEAKESMTVMLAHYQKMIRRPNILILCCIRFFSTFSWGN